MEAQRLEQLLQMMAEGQRQQQQTNVALQQAVQQQAQLMVQQEQRSHAEVMALRQSMAEQQQSFVEALKQVKDRRAGVIDVKAVGKPERFAGNKQKLQQAWPNWSFTFSTWLASQWAHGTEILEWAMYQGSTTITQDVVKDRLRSHPHWEGIVELNAQLFVALVSLTEDDAKTIVKNSEKASGLDAWRRLWNEYDPNNPVANFRMLRKITHPPTCTELSVLRGAIESWETRYKEYKERTGETLGDAHERSALMSLCPDVLQEHLDYHTSRLTTYKLLRDEITQFLDARQARSQGAVPMDVDSLDKGKSKGKDKSKGKPSGTYNDGCCYNCGEPGHIARDCWWHQQNHPQQFKGKGKGKAKGKGKDAKGKGKGAKSNGKGGKKGVNSLENDLAGDESWRESEWQESAWDGPQEWPDASVEENEQVYTIFTLTKPKWRTTAVAESAPAESSQAKSAKGSTIDLRPWRQKKEPIERAAAGAESAPAGNSHDTIGTKEKYCKPNILAQPEAASSQNMFLSLHKELLANRTSELRTLKKEQCQAAVTIQIRHDDESVLVFLLRHELRPKWSAASIWYGG